MLIEHGVVAPGDLRLLADPAWCSRQEDLWWTRELRRRRRLRPGAPGPPGGGRSAAALTRNEALALGSPDAVTTTR